MLGLLIIPSSPASFDVLGIPVSTANLAQVADQIAAWSEDQTGRYICIRDVHGVMRAQDDPELLRIHREAALVTPDGMPLVVLGKLLGCPVSRVCGPDLLPHVISSGRDHGLRHYFFGGAEGVAAKLADALRTRFPGVEIAGWETPPFRALTDSENEDILRRIKESRADVVWVGLGTPKQEYWMHEVSPRSSATFIGVGAAFDFHTGGVSRAPKWMQVSMLEWLYRLASEPRRLWKRYLVLGPRFALLVLARLVSRKAAWSLVGGEPFSSRPGSSPGEPPDPFLRA